MELQHVIAIKIIITK